MSDFLSSSPLKSAPNVFLDTVVFVEEPFNYKSPRIQALADLAADDRVKVFLTEITAREIRANRRDLVARSASKLR